MDRFLIFLFIIICPNFLSAQILEVNIVTSVSKDINYSISINGKQRFKDVSEPNVFLNVNANDSILIEYFEDQYYFFTLPDSIKKTDTITKIIEFNKVQKVNEVLVSAGKYDKIVRLKNDVIIDYYLHPTDLIILLIRNGNNHYLKLKYAYSSISKDSLLLDSPVYQIFRDPIGNFFLIGKKHALQFNIVNQKFVLQKPVTRMEFNDFIAPLVLSSHNLAVFESWTDHNQRYSLIAQNNHASSILYEYFDSSKYENASYHYNKAVEFYMSITHEKENVILLGLWDGNLISLPNRPNSELNPSEIDPTADLLRMTTWSAKIASKKLMVNTYDMEDNLLILNAENNRLIKFSKPELCKERTIYLDFNLTGDYFLDFFFDNLYMFDQNKVVTTVYKLNCDEGQRTKIGEIEAGLRPDNIKVMNDTVYFTTLNDNQYKELIMLKK